jgi:acetyl-CoA synthetase
MSDDIFKKTPQYFKVPPNLPDYESTYKNFSYDEAAKTELAMFEDGKMNAAYQAVDKHLRGPKKDKLAFIWEGANGEKEQFTYAQIAEQSNKFGNYLKSLGVVRGDRVFIFLPRIPELYFSFLGIMKIGAIAGSMFSAFQEQALLDRLENSGAKVLITNKELSARIVNIREKLPELKHVIIADDPEFEKQLAATDSALEIEHMDKDEYAFMLYTSGTTGKPKGIVHRHYAVLSEHLTSKYVLDLHDDDVYWCTADPGWVTGIAYEIIGPWSMGVTQVVQAGRFDPATWYKVLQDYKVTVWYTAPTAIRMLMAAGDDLVKQYNLSALRHILSVGEPLNPEALKWGIKVYGLPFHDTWWQTETGAQTIINMPCNDIKIGAMGKPFLGLVADIVDDAGNPVPLKTEGNIALRPGWPSMMQTCWQRKEKYDSYFVNGWYISGDHGWKDEDGYFWFIGRADDVIKTSGERVGPFEVESALVETGKVIEAGVIGKPDAVRGELIKAFVVLTAAEAEKAKDPAYAEKLKEELAMYVKTHLAGHAYPREMEFTDKLPKTRSGKIMRRILKAKELGQPIGDTSTLEDY